MAPVPPRRRHARLVLARLALAWLVLLTGCAVQLVSDYDDQMDAGLTQANTDITAFVNKMVDAAGTPAGEYSGSKDFYVTEQARLSTLRVRAEAHRALQSCPSASVIKSAVIGNLPSRPPGGPIPMPTPEQVIAKLPQDDCGVVLISLIQDSFNDLETFHKAQGPKGIPASARDPILVGGLGSLIHSAIQVQVATKSGKSGGGS